MIRLPALCLLAGVLAAVSVDPLDPYLFIEEDSGPSVITVTGIAPSIPGQRLLVLASFADGTVFTAPAVNYDGFSSTATITITPRPNANTGYPQEPGSHYVLLTITVAVDDGSAGGGTDRTSVSMGVLVSPVNDPPTLTPPANTFTQINEDDPPRAFTITGISPGPANEAGESIGIFATSTAPDILVIDAVAYVPGASTATVTIHPVANRSSGNVFVILTAINDDGYGNRKATSVLWVVWIVAQPDPTVLAIHQDLEVTPGGLVAITAGDLLLTDADNPSASALTYRLRTLPAGSLLKDGVALAAGDGFTQADINAGRLAYRHGDTGSEAIALAYLDDTRADPVVPFIIYATPAGLARPEVVLAAATAAYTEGGSPAALDASVTDPHATSFAGGSLTVSLVAGAAAGDRLDLAEQGLGAGQVHLDGATVLVAGRLVATWTAGADARSLAIAFTTADATPAAVTTVLRAVRFSSTSRDPGSATRTVSIVADNGVAVASDPALVAIAVTPVDDPPVVATTWIAGVPGVPVAWPLAAQDPDSAAFTWSVVAQPAAGAIAVVDGSLRLTPDAPGTYTAQVAVADATSTATGSITVLVTDPDAAQPVPASDPPHEAFAGTALDHDLMWSGASDPLIPLLTGDLPTSATVTAGTGGIVHLHWDVPADASTADVRRFGVLATDPVTRAAAHWPLLIRIHPTPQGIR